MIHITEEQSAAAITHELAYDAVKRALVAAAGEEARLYPVVIGYASRPDCRFTLKSGADATLAGVKIGSYFPTNDAIGMPRHNSCTLLFDQEKGRIGAIVEGGKVNAYRTAAADAVAVDALARADAKVLALFGTGHQAAYEVRAVARVRALETILVVGRNAEKTAGFVADLVADGLPARACGAEEAVRAADIVVTATNAMAPLFEAAWVKPGTHVSSMGSDGGGKQELPPALLARARLTCDLPSQSTSIGEMQYAPEGAEVVAVGAVVAGTVPGRVSEEEITVFDSSGISLQDLYMAEALIARLAA
ncbi:ornithine cyclodeaminase family protein [Maritimibacter alkaliphilus]|uniref:ornithine cyclodeaminase family protein n=1 Tax=Maritimibacter alkaliphilus TaxID=404236 RepID=UPI001C943C53|nr:ornithine cyclodeaminase family protein [Maritimibacter alkaliphilus]MBY6091519.1 ornithine cyclodeaminase family protein [Maritimibacter alkaliphilus]